VVVPGAARYGWSGRYDLGCVDGWFGRMKMHVDLRDMAFCELSVEFDVERFRIPLVDHRE
jgi:hypothetical protein